MRLKRHRRNFLRSPWPFRRRTPMERALHAAKTAAEDVRKGAAHAAAGAAQAVREGASDAARTAADASRHTAVAVAEAASRAAGSARARKAASQRQAAKTVKPSQREDVKTQVGKGERVTPEDVGAKTVDRRLAKAKPARGGKVVTEAALARSPKARRRIDKSRRAYRREARMQSLSALGYVLAAGLFLFWPAEGGPGWRKALDFLRGRDAQAAEIAAAEAAEPQRGRAATSPWRIPLRGWRDIATRTWDEFNRDRIMATAAGVTFFTLLAIFPGLAAFVSLYGLFSDVHAAQQQLRILAGFMPHAALVFVGDEMLRLAGGEHGGLGIAFVLGLLISLWSANGAVKALFGGLNVAYEERESRGLVRLNLVSLAFTVGALLFSAVALSSVVAVPVMLRFVGLDAGSIWLTELRWPAMLALLVFGLSLLYRFGPSRDHAKWMWLTPGSLFAAVMWLLASLLFSLYVANFAHYDKTYGSLGAAIGFMTWLWYSTIIVLVGAELNAEIEHQTAVDTTTGPHRPMGDRGAHMADTLGPTREEIKSRPKGVRHHQPLIGREVPNARRDKAG